MVGVRERRRGGSGRGRGGSGRRVAEGRVDGGVSETSGESERGEEGRRVAEERVEGGGSGRREERMVEGARARDGSSG